MVWKAITRCGNQGNMLLYPRQANQIENAESSWGDLRAPGVIIQRRLTFYRFAVVSYCVLVQPVLSFKKRLQGKLIWHSMKLHIQSSLFEFRCRFIHVIDVFFMQPTCNAVVYTGKDAVWLIDVIWSDVILNPSCQAELTSKHCFKPHGMRGTFCLFRSHRVIAF